MLHDAGLPIAVATSGTRKWVDYVTDRLGIRHLLSACISGDDVTKPKPDPQPYQRAAAALAVPPTRCAVIEDSPTGYRSAVAAGCQVIVPPTHAAEPMAGVLSGIRAQPGPHFGVWIVHNLRPW